MMMTVSHQKDFVIMPNGTSRFSRTSRPGLILIASCVFLFFLSGEFACANKIDLIESGKTCGLVHKGSGLIVNGAEFRRGSFPWLVALMYVGDNSPSKFFCGGTLISAKHVLTGKLSK
jgi:hypothetical protein